MAEVFLAEQTSLGRQVALKVLNSDLASDPAYVQRFDREARAAAALVHASIVQIYEVGQDDGVHFIAQEYVPGRNLGDVIRREGRIRPGRALAIIRQVAGALHKAAEHGIVHRDIKPENILLTQSGEVKVADFGLARGVTAKHATDLTQVGITMGTPLYMSPEQIEGRPLDGRSDIYSLGVTAYHMLSGEPPFAGDTPLSVAVQHLNERPPSLESATGDVPAGLARVVHSMIEKKPDARPATPAALLGELRTLAAVAAEQGWGSGVEDWSAAELSAIAGPPSLATARLGDLMKANSRIGAPRYSYVKWLGLAAACLLVGIGLARLARPPALLADVQSGPPRRDTVNAQIYNAATADTEAAWMAIERYHPDADAYSRELATEGLVRFYLFRRREFEKAVPILEQLAERSPSDSWSHAFAYAGLTIAYTGMGRPDAASTAIEQITPEVRGTLAERDPRLDDMLRATLDVLYQKSTPPPFDGSSD
jgi:serine/threonine-protein kinase